MCKTAQGYIVIRRIVEPFFFLNEYVRLVGINV